MALNFSLPNAAKAALVALTLAGGAMTAAPAQAASNSSNFSFEFSIGGGRHYDGRDHRRHCASERQVVRALRNNGYRNVDVRGGNRNVLRLRATKGGWVYAIRFDRCDFSIRDRERLHRV